MKSFQTVEEKLSESEFFLSKLEEVGPNIFQARCYFSAFVSAARSVTFVLQTVMIQNKDFQSWYKIEIAKLGGTNYGKFFVDRRNEVIHEGETRINSGYYKRNSKTGTRIAKLYFSTMDPSNPLEIVEENI